MTAIAPECYGAHLAHEGAVQDQQSFESHVARKGAAGATTDEIDSRREALASAVEQTRMTLHACQPPSRLAAVRISQR